MQTFWQFSEAISLVDEDEMTRTYLFALNRLAQAVGGMQSLSVHAATGHNKAVKDVLNCIENLKNNVANSNVAA